MAFTLVASSGYQKGANLSWTHTFTLNNLVTGQEQNDSANNSASGHFKDSSGTPKNLNMDVAETANGTAKAGIFSLIVPSGFTSPLKGATVYEEWMAAEWSGNDTTTALDTSTTSTATTAASPQNSGSINTGANAGLVLASASINTGSASTGTTVTGTSFTDTYSASHDGTNVNDSASDGGSHAYRTASCASQTGLHNTWAWTSGNATNFGTAIASYNAAASATPIQHMDAGQMTEVGTVI